MIKLLIALALAAVTSVTLAQQQSGNTSQPKSYKEVITDKAISQPGLFTVHKIGERWYFEIPDSILGRDILVSTRFVKTSSGTGFGGQLANILTINWVKGPTNTIFLKVLTLINVSIDSTQPIAQAVINSNEKPIAAVFDIKAYGKGLDSSSTTVIDVTDFFKGDNQIIGLKPSMKRSWNLGGIASDRSYIESIHSYPINTEVRTTKTFIASASSGSSSEMPAAEFAGVVTMELNNSFLLLPKVPMRKRLANPRIGYYTSKYTVYGDSQQRSEETEFIHRWRLEPKDEDIEKWKRGELVEPKKQIVYYIDPATPKQWRRYLIAGINDWQVAFERIGFKNAIVGKEWPENDKTMTLEDARFSVVRYFASNVENAYGPNVTDPRSGEILESHIEWYHNIMKLTHDWYMIQAAAVDPRARKMKFEDDLMGDLIRFACAHEIGHTLGLAHNMGSSSKTPVEKLRDKAWVEAHGHTASIMDYARLNYVAQPEDNITSRGLYPRVGDYDKWAIQWGYQPIYGTKDDQEDMKVLNKMAIDSLKSNPRLWYGSFGLDPRVQTEDLGDNSVKASEYGLKNLKRILPNLPQWTKDEAGTYDNLEDMYIHLLGQFNIYMGHVARNVGGIQQTIKSTEEPGDIYEITPKATQKEAINFLNKQLFATPIWLINKEILNKIGNPAGAEAITRIQENTLQSLLSSARLYRMTVCTGRYGTNAYSVAELLADLKAGIWSELTTGNSIESHRRTLQKVYISALVNLINLTGPPSPTGLPITTVTIMGGDYRTSDIPSIVKAQLKELNTEVAAGIVNAKNMATKYHLSDIHDRITQALRPKP